MITSPINLAFIKCKKEKRPALLTYTVAGDNTKKKSLEILNSISNHADIVELGFPHNTPIADGGQIQTSAYRAIQKGIKRKYVFQIVNKFKINKNSKPILIANQKNLKRLYEVLVLQEVLKLNNTLTLSIDEFQRGLQIQFPAKEIIMENTFVIDENIADYFYQVNFYYESFEEEFKSKTKFLSD